MQQRRTSEIKKTVSLALHAPQTAQRPRALALAHRAGRAARRQSTSPSMCRAVSLPQRQPRRERRKTEEEGVRVPPWDEGDATAVQLGGTCMTVHLAFRDGVCPRKSTEHVDHTQSIGCFVGAGLAKVETARTARILVEGGSRRPAEHRLK